MSKITLHNYEAYLLDYLEGNLDSSLIEDLKHFALAHPELEIDLTETSLPYISASAIEADFKESLKKEEDITEDEELLAYFEGLMSSDEKVHFEKKLSENLELQGALKAYQKTILSVDSTEQFLNKSTLLKTEEDLVLSDLSIAYLENELSAEERINFEIQLETNGSLKKELRLSSKTILVAESEVVYPDKSGLKKETRVFVLFQRRLAFRAAAAILLLVFLSVIFIYMRKEENSESVVSQKKKSLDVEQALQENTKSRLEENYSLEKSLPEPSDELASRVEEKRVANITHSLEPEHNDLAAVPTRTPASAKDLNTESIIQKSEIHNTETSQLAEAKTEQVFNKLPVAPDSNTSVSHKITELATIEESADDDLYLKPAKNDEKGLWKRAVQLAQRVNKLGVKSIDGVEDSDNKQYRISFNSFSVEKK